MALNNEELSQLLDLLRRVNNTQIRGPVWHALIQVFPTVPLELIVLNDDNEVLLVYREDNEFKGWHHPGSVWNDWETIATRMQKLISGEIVKDAEIQITEPQSIGWVI